MNFFSRRFSIKFCIWNSNSLILSILWVWHLKIGPKSKKWSENILRDFWKGGINLSCDLLIFDPGPITHLYPKKNPNRAENNYNFYWKSEGDRALILSYFGQSNGYIWFQPSSGCKLGSTLDQKPKVWVRPVSVKIWVFQNAINRIEDYWWSEFQVNLMLFIGVIVQKPLKMGPIGSRTKKR